MLDYVVAVELCSLFREHKFVGCVDQTRALVQYQVKLENLFDYLFLS